ncbi:RNA polymerase sigma factor [Rosistilla oblonga]|uniref:sigma-70 family RNA polymerase sigma factor n=1 Tax=Rosistilla oblonga TaxID=2527990 RepID=UPI00118BDD75|nr:sigma-70 family RNA polymerase sigma factor [Rosistilla oblonga]QDV14720.1 RNA polymerase sigma factor [Rosistilla oblonga]
MLNTKTEAIAECSNDSREAFDVSLIARLIPQLTTIARQSIARRWQSKVGASDIVQNTFLEASNTLSSFSGSSIAEFNQWLRAILAHNLQDSRRRFVVAQMRSVEREQPLDRLTGPLLINSEKSPVSVAVSNEFDRELHRVIGMLDQMDQQILTLRYQQKLAFGEIGIRINMKEDTVRKRWGRILKFLQHKLRQFDSQVCSSRG